MLIKDQSTERPILYTFATSPYGLKVQCYLQYKGLPYDWIYAHPFNLERELPLGHSVPVLTIGNTSMRESTPIGIWLDERYPDLPKLLPPEEMQRERLLEIDHWVSAQLIPYLFRSIRLRESGEPISALRNAWKLANIMHLTITGGLNPYVRLIWGIGLQRAAFITDIMDTIDLKEPISKMRERLCQEFITFLNGGPFLDGQNHPSLADLSAYPQFIIPYCHGLLKTDYFLHYPKIVSWINRIKPYLGNQSSLAPQRLRQRAFPK